MDRQCGRVLAGWPKDQSVSAARMECIASLNIDHEDYDAQADIVIQNVTTDLFGVHSEFLNLRLRRYFLPFSQFSDKILGQTRANKVSEKRGLNTGA